MESCWRCCCCCCCCKEEDDAVFDRDARVFAEGDDVDGPMLREPTEGR